MDDPISVSGVKPVLLESFAETLRTEWFSLIVTVGLVVYAFYLIYRGTDSYRLSRQIANNPPERVASMAVGRTELEGTAQPVGTLYDRPFTEGTCLYASWEIQQEVEQKQSDGGSIKTWDTVASGKQAAPFDLDDGTGSVRVIPDEETRYILGDEHEDKVEVTSNDSLPATVESFLKGERTGWEDTAERPGGTHRYKQSVLPPEADTYVFGAATPKAAREVPTGASNEQRLEIGRDAGTDRFVISDSSERALASDLRKRGLYLIGVGVVLGAGVLYIGGSDLSVLAPLSYGLGNRRQ